MTHRIYRPKPRDSFFAQPSKEAEAAIGKIVAAVGKEPDSRPALAEELDSIHGLFVSVSAYTKKRTGPDSLKNIRKAAEVLAAKINSNWIVKEATKEIDLDKLCDTLRRLEVANRGRSPSLVEYLVSESLTRTYQRRFGAKPTITRNGTFVRFASAVLAEFDVPCEPETVIKALVRARKAKSQIIWQDGFIIGNFARTVGARPTTE
jgi:hypothetical protein